ncbi:MAG: glucose-1-phosphate thymidylyltransferase (strD) [uncultured bacterium]|nr:MAG: glucose-1-phosphate thymidylyltransferase (strD) [uncultured bacterium]
MQLVILAAGRGMRMKDLTDNAPKPMLQINGKPILAYKLEALPEEIDEIIFVIGYLGNQIQQYFGDFYAGKKISYVVQDDLNGTGGAVHLVKNFIEDDFLVMLGDDLYMKNDISKLLKCELGILALEVSDPTRFGIIYLDANGNLAEIVEKPEIAGPALANIGLYKLNKKFFDYPLVAISEREYGLPQTMVSMAKDFTIRIEKSSGWFPIGNPDDLERAKDLIQDFI